MFITRNKNDWTKSFMVINKETCKVVLATNDEKKVRKYHNDDRYDVAVSSDWLEKNQ